MFKRFVQAGLFAGLVGVVASACTVAELPESEDDPTQSAEMEIKGGKKCGDPNRTYVSHSTDQCALIHFLCAEGTPFFDRCGCGCDVSQTPCGPSMCGTGEVCCNASCGICTPPDGFCTQQICEPL